MSEKAVSVKSERNPSTHDDEKRSRRFRAVLIVATVVVPLTCIFFRLFVLVEPGLMWPTMYLTLMLFGVVLPGVTIGVGFWVSKRVPFVVWHVAITTHLFGAAVSLSVLPGWDNAQPSRPLVPDFLERFWLGFLDLVTFPAWMVLVYYVGAIAIALSWLVYRIDAFRAATGANEVADATGMAAVFAKLKGAKVNAKTIEVDDTAVTFKLDHEGIPVSQVRSQLASLEEHSEIVRGRSSVVADTNGGQSTVRFVHTDPHGDGRWRIWPGLSHPGGSYTDPIRTSYYSTGEMQWYSFVRTPDGYRSKVAPDFASPNDSFKGGQGATGSGKSGGSAIEIAEVASRRNVVIVYVDPAKLMQNAAWCLDMCRLAAGSPDASRILFNGLRRLGEWRANKLGELGYRNFTDEVFDATGIPWVHIYADEFDVATQNAAMDWLATKGRSLGFRISFTLPRAVGTKLSTDIRAAVGMWEQYGITQDYDKGFVLSEETIAAGANPEAFGITLPGVHYLDRAPGVDPKKYAIDCRTYQTRQDYADLRRAVETARATFTPADFTAEEYEVLGEVAEHCKPSVIRNGHLGTGKKPRLAGAAPMVIGATHQAGDLLERVNHNEEDEELDMQQTLSFEDLEDDEAAFMARLGIEPEDLIDTDTDAEQREFGPIDPRQPIPQTVIVGADADFEPDKPRATSTEQMNAELDAAIIRMAARGVQEFGSDDMRRELAVEMDPPRMSQRLSDLHNDAALNPPGVKLERLKRGRFRIVRLGRPG